MRPSGRAIAAARIGLVLAGCLASRPSFAQQLPLGSEFQVNTYTSSYQDGARIAAADDGTFLVVWASSLQDGDSSSGIFGQRFNFLGQKVGSEFEVTTYTTGDQTAPAIAATGNGGYVVVWQSAGQDGSDYGIFGQRFGLLPGPVAKFGKLGSEFPINTYTTGSQSRPAVASGGKGDFVVVWESYGQDGNKLGVFGQRFDGSGSKVSTEFQVNTATSGNQYEPVVGMDRAGGFVVAWTGSDAEGRGILGQRFDASGTKAGAEFPVNTFVGGDEKEPAIAVRSTGDFLVVWTGASEILGQIYNASGEKVGPEFDADFNAIGTQDRPSATIDRSGNYVVAWDSTVDQVDISTHQVVGQRLDPTGTFVNQEFVLSQNAPADFVKIAEAGSGLVAVWSHPDGSASGVTGRREDRLPVSIDVDSRTANGTTSDANGLLEPGETVFLGPIWSNRSVFAFGDFGGTAAFFDGPPGGTYSIVDSSADYGPMPAGTFANCDDGTPDACYRLSVAGPRPSVHWDANLIEDVAFGGSHSWTLHVGDSFSDVPRSQPFYKKIETMLHHGITLGCGGTKYCPSSPVARDQMAIFIAKALAGAGKVVPTTGVLNEKPYNCVSAGVSRFSDVLPTDPACKHIHFIASRNVTLGCNPGQYCPAQTVTRDAMASFIAKAIVAPGGGAAVPLTFSDSGTGRSYSCDPASPNTHFTDVPPSNPFCRHIHFLWAKGIVDGCSATQYCPAASVLRDAMAKFISNGFGLQLYQP